MEESMGRISTITQLIKKFEFQFFTFEENNLIKGNLPLFSYRNNTDYSENELKSTLLSTAEDSNYHSLYINGGCHDLCHYLCNLFEGNNIKSGKIWCFSPSIYTLVSKEKLNIANTLNYLPDLKWEYHVAPIIFDLNDNPIIIDQRNEWKLYTIESWLNSMNSPRSIFTLTNSEWYLFNTLNGLNVRGIKLPNIEKLSVPTWFPKIISGDFFKYNGLCKAENWIPNGLAVNEVAQIIYNREIINQEDEHQRTEYINVLSNINTLDQVFKNKTLNNQFLSEYRAEYNSLLDKWINIYQGILI